MSEQAVRSGKTVLVMHAHVMAAVACIRSLGRAGYRVVAASPSADALGFRSNYAAEVRVHPPYAEPERFLSWLEHEVAASAIDAIVPCEELLLTLRPDLNRFAHLLPCSTEREIVELCFSKFRLFEYFAAEPPESPLRENLPRTLLIRSEEDARAVAGCDFAPWAYVKADAALARTRRGSCVTRIAAAQVDEHGLAEWLLDYQAFLVQEHVDGIGVGAFFLIWDGQAVASFMHRRLHEVPHTGGVSSYRRAWWHPEIYEDALRRVQSVGWQGIAMLEYRWDEASDRFHLMEMNSRYWGSMHLAMHCGVDFPRLWLDSFFGIPIVAVHGGDRAYSCRHTFPGEVRHLASCLRDRAVSAPQKLATVGEFVKLSMDPRVKTDLWYPGDRQLYWRGLYRYLQSVAGR